MNSEQILLLVAVLGVVTIVIVTSLGSKNKKPKMGERAHATSGHVNRAERRKRH